MELSTRILLQACARRRIDVTILDAAESLVRLQRGSLSEIVAQATRTRLDSLAVEGLLRSKGATKRVLRAAGIPVAPGVWFGTPERALELERRLLAFDVVVKPNVQSGGTGVVFVDAGDAEGYRGAVEEASRWCRSVLVEVWIRHPEFRLLVVGGRLHSVVARTPAHVLGDGASTVRELVAHKNAERNAQGRGPDYDLCLDATELRSLHLQGLGPESVPPAGERVGLRWNSNVHTGGDAEVVDDHAPGYAEFAEQAARALGSAIVGLDVLASDVREEPGRGVCCALEANFNPDISLHALPTVGPAHDPSDAILDALGF
jgi:D-alanine-D-alanine ligase-like ATP-grasp enzyme